MQSFYYLYNLPYAEFVLYVDSLCRDPFISLISLCKVFLSFLNPDAEKKVITEKNYNRKIRQESDNRNKQ